MTQPIRPTLACSDTILTDDNYDQISYPIFASTKLDGWRCLTDREDNPLTRSGKPLPNIHTRREIIKAGLAGFDGELLASKANDFNAMQKAQSAFSTILGEPDFHYHIFDNWMRKITSFKEYWPQLKASQALLPEWATIIPQLVITSPETLALFVKETTADGYEGVIVRSLNAPYKHGRSTWKQGYMLKAKNYTYEEGIIIGIIERMTNMNPKELDELGYSKRPGGQAGKVPAGTLGSFIIKNLQGETFSIGTGHLNAMEKQQIWDDRNLSDTYINKLITFKHFAGSGVRNKPRHGQFVSTRHIADL